MPPERSPITAVYTKNNEGLFGKLMDLVISVRNYLGMLRKTGEEANETEDDVNARFLEGILADLHQAKDLEGIIVALADFCGVNFFLDKLPASATDFHPERKNEKTAAVAMALIHHFFVAFFPYAGKLEGETKERINTSLDALMMKEANKADASAIGTTGHEAGAEAKEMVFLAGALGLMINGKNKSFRLHVDDAPDAILADHAEPLSRPRHAGVSVFEKYELRPNVTVVIRLGEDARCLAILKPGKNPEQYEQDPYCVILKPGDPLRELFEFRRLDMGV